MQIEPILSEIEDAGLRVCNLFQLEDGVWQANLYDDEQAWNFGRGNTPSEALTSALKNAQTTSGTRLTPRVTELLLDKLF